MFLASSGQFLAILPVHAVTSACETYSRYQQSVRFESVHQVFSLINGSFGAFLIYACLFGAALLGILACLTKQDALLKRSLKLLAFTLLLFIARLFIAGLYFCRSFEVWQLLEKIVDIGGGIIGGIILIGLPAGFLGLYLAQAISEIVVSTYKDHIKDGAKIEKKAWLAVVDFLFYGFTLITVLVLGWNNLITPLLFLLLGAYLYWRGFTSAKAPVEKVEVDTHKEA